MKKFFYLLAALIATISIIGVLAMTTLGQVLGLPGEWTLHWYYLRFVVLIFVFVAFCVWVAINQANKYLSQHWIVMSGLAVTLCFLVQILVMPTAFRTEQFSASYHTVDKADRHIPQSDQTVYITNLEGETRIFPRYHLKLSQVVGWQVDDSEYAMTYCSLSNLPMVVEADYGLEQPKLEMLSRVDNNLVLKDMNNGTAIQQISMESKFTDHAFTVHPNTMMDWKKAKQMYPNALVYLHQGERKVDKALTKLLAKRLETHRDSDNPDFIFNTLDLEDERLNPKQEVFGYNNGDKQFALDPDFAKENHGVIINFDEEMLQIGTDGDVVQLFDFYTKEQISMHNGVHFGVWSHFYPDTVVISDSKN